MYGAILGDIIGSPYEFDRGEKTKDFPLFSSRSRLTDDTVMTVAVADAFLSCPPDADGGLVRELLVASLRKWGHAYPNAGYGIRFHMWLQVKNPTPYNSFGNGSAMRVSPCALMAVTLEEAQALARISAKVTHNHPEGIKGAEAVASAVFMAKTGCTKEEIGAYIRSNYYEMKETLDQIRRTYRFDESCQGTVPQAITAFLESESFEDAIRNAISMGGDSDTVGAITGSIAWTYYWRQESGYCIDHLPEELQQIKDRAMKYIPAEFAEIARELREVARRRAGTYDRMGGCTGILSPKEWEEEGK